MSMPSLDEGSLDELYRWLQSLPLSKPIRNLPRDMSDGVLVAEIVAHFLPRYVALSNFTSVNSAALKRYNWETLNKIVFTHLNYQVTPTVIQKVVNGQPGAIEYVLFGLRHKIEQAIQQGRFRPNRNRSRSTSRAGSQLSLNNGDSMNDLVNMMTSSSFGVVDPDCTNMAIRAAAAQQFARQMDQLESPSRPSASSSPRPMSAARDTRDEQIEQLNNRMKHLERLVQLKDVRINELTKQLEKYKEFVNRMKNGSSPDEQPSQKIQPANRNGRSTDSDSSLLQETNDLMNSFHH